MQERGDFPAFPSGRTPYGIQQQFMRELYGAISRRSICLFESPTGATPASCSQPIKEPRLLAQLELLQAPAKASACCAASCSGLRTTPGRLPRLHQVRIALDNLALVQSLLPDLTSCCAGAASGLPDWLVQRPQPDQTPGCPSTPLQPCTKQVQDCAHCSTSITTQHLTMLCHRQCSCCTTMASGCWHPQPRSSGRGTTGGRHDEQLWGLCCCWPSQPTMPAAQRQGRRLSIRLAAAAAAALL